MYVLKRDIWSTNCTETGVQ